MSKRKILIVDDEKGFTDMLSLNLEAKGSYEVQVENDASQALSTALAFRPDLILLDIIMPQKKGVVVAREIEKNETLRGIPIVFLTATVAKDDTDAQMDKSGGHTFISKPTSLDVLLACIEKKLVATRP